MSESRQDERGKAPAERRLARGGARMAWPRAALLLVVLAVLAWLVVLGLIKWVLR